MSTVMMKQIFSFNQFERDTWFITQASLIPAGSKVLDAGASTCPYRHFFAYSEYRAQDFLQLSQEFNRSRTLYGSINYLSNILAIPVQVGSIVAVICREMLRQFLEPIKVLSEFARMLRSGGTLLRPDLLGADFHQEPYHFSGGYTPHYYTIFLPVARFANFSVKAKGGFFKFYNQESRRFSDKLRSGKFNFLEKLRICLFWLITLPWFQFVMPELSHFLARNDCQRDVTVGYIVRAERR